MSSIEPWVGLECTVNRIQDQFVNQCDKNLHYERSTDLELFAALGAKRIRYPALWELTATHEGRYDWTANDKALKKMQELGLQPIIGLLHHGSGPKFTSLIDPKFPEKFAAYASAFAERYPWVTDYTPINEILTTAFFSCLYGHWYPHRSNDIDTVTAVYNQVQATVLAMTQIKKVNPIARLIQTEDLGKAQGTKPLEYQIDFQNQRRWLSFDLLCGKVSNEHPLFKYLSNSGLTQKKIDWLQLNKMPPDILGINHYRLSNRFLDHRLEYHPSWSHGGNGIDFYADVGAIDTADCDSPTAGSILEEAWNRYSLPVAITEAHVNGGREFQLQWLKKIWTDANLLKKNKGIDVRAVTAWSLLGTYDWDTLCTKNTNFYEPGVFDVRTNLKAPRETAIAKMIRGLSETGDYDHPVLDHNGLQTKNYCTNSRTLLITGANGTLAKSFARICEQRNLNCLVLDRAQMDIANTKSVQVTLKEIKPWAVINCAGYVKVDSAENDSENCFRENVIGATTLAAECAHLNIAFMSFSSDLVFDGKLSKPYSETDSVAPLNIYGQSKVLGERQVFTVHDKALIIRTSSFFSPWDEHNFVSRILKKLAQKETVQVASDILISPTFIPDLVNSALDLLIDGETGLIHLVNEGVVSWANFANMAAEAGGYSSYAADFIIPTAANQMNYTAKRPQYSALTSGRFNILQNLENAIGRHFEHLKKF